MNHVQYLKQVWRHSNFMAVLKLTVLTKLATCQTHWKTLYVCRAFALKMQIQYCTPVILKIAAIYNNRHTHTHRFSTVVPVPTVDSVNAVWRTQCSCFSFRLPWLWKAGTVYFLFIYFFKLPTFRIYWNIVCNVILCPDEQYGCNMEK